MVGNIQKAERQLELESNRGKLPIDNIADIDGFGEAVWFSGEAITKILSIAVVKQEYEVSYDGDDFIIHRAKHGFPYMISSRTRVGYMYWMLMTLRVMQAILSSRPLQRICNCSLSAKSPVLNKHATFRRG